MKITVTTEINASVNAVWQAYTTPANIIQWNYASDDWHCTQASVDLCIGGQFSSRMEAKDGSMGFDFQGEYTEIVEHKSLTYKLAQRYVNVTFQQNDSICNVTIIFDSDDSHSDAQQQQGWQNIINNFKKHVETQ